MAEEKLKEEEVRREKLKKLKEIGVLPYPYRYGRTHTSSQIVEKFDDLSTQEKPVAVAGRILTMRRHGKTCFLHIADENSKIQIYLRQDTLNDQYKLLEFLDIGDFLGIEGSVFKTKTGEITILAKTVAILAKSLRPLPEKWHGLKDLELRYRYRYLDLIANEESRELFQAKTKIYNLIREFFNDRGYFEVETPILQPIYGGATANPFSCFYNAIDADVYLRIADELYLKRLIVGGYERVYEIGKDFRNEGLSRFHNPEFTMLEAYESYKDYNDMMELVEDLFIFLVKELKGTNQLVYQGNEISFKKPFAKIYYVDELTKVLGTNPLAMDKPGLRKLAEKFGLELAADLSIGKIIDKLFSGLIQDKLIGPAFICDHPKLISPLAKQHRKNKDVVERFEPVICGVELGNSFSELNDPIEQRQRFEEQLREQEEGIAEIDEDFLFALEHGMPPTAGLGIGIERLCMVLLDKPTLRDVILFPQLRKE